MIEIKNLSFSYGKKQILKNISATFSPGKFYAVIGINGSGKTTLCNHLARLLKPMAGEILLDGVPYKNLRRKEFAQKVSLLPQGRNVPNMCGYDLVCAGRYPYLSALQNCRDADKHIVKEAMQRTDAAQFADKNLKHLSGGERQRVYLAMVAAQDTTYILLDEPTTHLDMAAEYKSLQVLTDMKKQGKCIIAVLHDLSAALAFADEILVLHNGKIEMIGTPKEIVDGAVFEKIFGVYCHVLKIEGKDRYIFAPLHP